MTLVDIDTIPKCSHSYIAKKCISVSGNFKVMIYDTAFEMLSNAIPGRGPKELIPYYEKYIGSESYKKTISILKLKRFDQPSIKTWTDMKLFGLSTKPYVSVTREGQSYELFAHTVLHEIGHLKFGIEEKTANDYADMQLVEIFKKWGNK